MSRFARPLVLAFAMAALAGGAMTAQDKKAQDPKKVEKKDDKKVKGKVEVYEGKDGWRYRVKNAEGKVIAMTPKGYKEKEDLMKVLEEVKAILGSEKPAEVKEKDDK